MGNLKMSTPPKSSLLHVKPEVGCFSVLCMFLQFFLTGFFYVFNPFVLSWNDVEVFVLSQCVFTVFDCCGLCMTFSPVVNPVDLKKYWQCQKSYCSKTPSLAMPEQIHIESTCTLILRVLHLHVPWVFRGYVLYFSKGSGADLIRDLL